MHAIPVAHSATTNGTYPSTRSRAVKRTPPNSSRKTNSTVNRAPEMLKLLIPAMNTTDMHSLQKDASIPIPLKWLCCIAEALLSFYFHAIAYELSFFEYRIAAWTTHRSN